MKKIAFFILLGAMTTFTFAQIAQSTMIDFNKTPVPGVIITTTEYDAATVQAALQARMERIGGLKGANSNGFRFYDGQVFTDFGNTRLDIYTRVLPPTKKNKEIIINLLVVHETFVSPTSDPELNQKMLDFLTNFSATYLKEFDTNKKVAAHSKELEKMEKDYKKLVSDRSKLTKSLEDKEKEIASKEAEIEKTKEALGILKDNR